MRHRPAFAYLLPCSVALTLPLLAYSAVAQAEPATEGAAPEGAAPETSAAGAAPADANTDPHASPEVQSQVGLGTQKEDTEDTAQGAKDSTAEIDAPKEEAQTFGHGHQFGLRSNLALGYKVLIRFDDSPLCDPPTMGTEEEKQVCGYATPPSIDLALSFALFDSIEPYLWFRMGLGEHEKTYTAATRWAGAGIRIYTMSDSQLKLFFEPAVAMELEGATAAAPPGAKYDTDFVGHVHFGLQYDFLANLGVYFSAGPNVSFVRAIGTEFEGAVGLQVRGP